MNHEYRQGYWDAICDLEKTVCERRSYLVGALSVSAPWNYLRIRNEQKELERLLDLIRTQRRLAVARIGPLSPVEVKPDS